MFFLVCAARVDLGFLLDGSGSIIRNAKGNFRRLINFMKVFLSLFPYRGGKTRVGVVLFSTRAHLIFGFNRYKNSKSIYRALDRIRYPHGKTYLGRALNFAGRRLFRGGLRRGRKRFLVVLTDGISLDSVRRPSAMLRRKGVEVATIGIGRKLRRKQLYQVASTRKHVIVTGFGKLLLGRMLSSLKGLACSPFKPSKF